MAQTTSQSLSLLKGLLKSEQILEGILDSIEQSFVVLDNSFKIILVNRRAQENVLKTVEKEIKIGETLWDYIPVNRQDAARRISKKLLSGEKVFVTKKFVNSLGNLIWIEYTFIPFKGSGGENEFILISGTEITDLKYYTGKLRETERKYRDIVQSQTEMICKFRLDGTITFVNNAYCRFFGITEPDIIGTNFYHIIPESLKEKAKSDIMSLSPSNPFYNYTQSLTGYEGKTLWITATNMAFFDNDGNITEIQAIGKDITAQKEIQDQLIKAKEKAEESERIKSVFLSNMSHEVRTPLNGILGFSNLLLTALHKKDKVEEYVDLIQQSGEQLLGIIDDLLEISLIETNQLTIHNSNIYLPNIINNMYDYFIEKINVKEKRCITIKKFLPANGPNFLNIDGVRLYQIFMKLLKNAIKFTKTGSVEFGYYQSRYDTIRFFVRDTGIGIPQNKHKIVFETFRQADESLCRTYGGNGLGLSIAKALIENMGSRLNFESKPNDGSHFYFDFIIHESIKKDLVYKEGNRKRRHYDLKGKTILIVEDTYMNYILLKEFLKHTNAAILPAHSGMDAMKTFENKSSIDLVLLDIRLPDINGFEIARRFKKINPSIPIIAQTAYSIKSEKVEAFNAGCDGFLVKPISKDLLLEMVYECLVREDKMSDYTHPFNE